MRYFVTGATGFIGGRVTRMLIEDGHEVIALVRSLENARDLADLGVALAPGDITERESMRAPMRGVDGVFHIAGWYKVGMRDKRPARQINVDGTRNVLELMRELEIQKGIYTSTLAVFSSTHGRVVDESYRYVGPHLSAYDRTKWIAHYEVAAPLIEAGLPLVIVQPGAVYGPGDPSSLGDSLRQYLQGRLPIAPQETGFCWGHIDDTARAHLLAMEHGRIGESYIIAGAPHTLIEALLLAQRITGIPAPRLRPKPELLRGLARLMALIENVAPLPPMYTAETLRVAAGVTYWGSNAKARRELSICMRPLEDGLRETLEYELQVLSASGGSS